MPDEPGQGSLIVVISAYPLGQNIHLMDNGEGVVQGSDDKAEPPQKILGRKLGNVAPDDLAEAV